jgi:hypothetical protein
MEKLNQRSEIKNQKSALPEVGRDLRARRAYGWQAERAFLRQYIGFDQHLP